jgi:hypothetical protein
MTPRPSPALLQALALWRSPRGARPGPEDRLPEGVELLVRIVGGDAQALAFAIQTTREAEASVRDAAAFYIQQVMFATGSDSYRVLGLDPGASDEQLKSHHRWLTRWLHPDRNRDEWEAVFSERVNRAWQDLRNSERRQRYDMSRAGAAAVGPFPTGKQIVARREVRLEGAEPGLSLRWLPHVILGSLGLTAVAIVALYYVLGFAGQSPELSAAPTENDQGLEASALANPRIAHGNPQAHAEVPQKLATSPAVDPVAERPALGPSMTLASEEPTPPGPLPSEPPVSEPLPSEPPPAAVLPSAPLAIKQASVPVLDPVKPRPAAPRQEQAASASSGGASRIEHRVVPTVPVPVLEARSAPVSQREADRIIGRFSEVYEHGDLAGMRAMFTADATSPDGGLDAILDEYDQLFGRSKHRLLDVQDVNWSASGRTFTIVANYEATVKTGLFARIRSQGKLRMEMRQVNDQWRIYRLEHNERTD